MKILKETGTYLKDQAKVNENISYILFAISGIGFIYSLFIYSSVLLKFLLIFIFFSILSVGIFFSKNSMNYYRGLKAENLITGHLQNLDNKHILINDVKLQNSYGNIDHILLGPNGIFVIETKNFEGEIICYGDVWYQYKQEWKNPEEYEIKSPSKQVKGNALKLNQLIKSKGIFMKPLKIWIDGVIVFTNDNVKLNLNNPTVPILKINELYNYVKNKKSNIRFSSQELESIGKVILNKEKKVPIRKWSK